MTEIDVSNMTPQQRLKQIEILLSTAAKAINCTDEEVKEQKDRIAALELGQISLHAEIESVTRLLGDTIATIARQQEEANRRYQEHQAEIDRIWRYLQSRTGNGNSPL